MSNDPDTAEVIGDAAGASGAVSLVLWAALARNLVAKGILANDDVRRMLKAAHHEFAQEHGAADAMALIARIEMNIPPE